MNLQILLVDVSLWYIIFETKHLMETNNFNGFRRIIILQDLKMKYGRKKNQVFGKIWI